MPKLTNMSQWRAPKILRFGLLALMSTQLTFLPTGWAANLEAGDLKLLQKGQVIVKEEQTPGEKSGRKRLIANIIIDRPLDQVWQVVAHQDTLFKGDPHMKKVQVVKHPAPSQEWIEYTLSISRFLPTFIYTTQVDYLRTANKIKFHRVSGSFKEFEGFGHLTPFGQGNQTLLTYGLEVDLGFFIPPFIVRQVLKNEMPAILNNVERQVYKQFPGTP